MSRGPKTRGKVERMNVRLPQEIFERIDKVRALRPGYVSRNTWIAEAIQEKLEKELRTGGDLLKPVFGAG